MGTIVPVTKRRSRFKSRSNLYNTEKREADRMTHTNLRQQAIELINQLPQERLTAVVRFIELLNQPSAEERSLIEVIQRRLSPSEQQRLDELRDRNEWSTLTETEHRELIAYEDRLEQQNVTRLAALMRLAKISNIDLPTLNHQFRSELQSNDVS